MRIIAPEPRGANLARRPAAPQQEDRHDAIARRIRNLGTGSQHNCVERFIVERETLAREVELLGYELAQGT